MSSSSGPRRTEFPVAPCERGVDRNMQAINLEANLEANFEVVLFTGTAFAILVKTGQIGKKSLQITAVFFIIGNRVCKISCKEREP